jgi:hypothetical protein
MSSQSVGKVKNLRGGSVEKPPSHKSKEVKGIFFLLCRTNTPQAPLFSVNEAAGRRGRFRVRNRPAHDTIVDAYGVFYISLD